MFWKKKRATDTNDTFKAMIRLCKDLGMPGELIVEDVFLYIPLCFIEVFTDGELQTHHAPPANQRLVEWFGELHCGEGRFVKELAAVRDGKRQADNTVLDTLQGGSAYLLAQNIITGKGPFPAIDPLQAVPSPVRLEGSDVFFGGNYGQGEYRERLNRPINSVLALDPGIRAIHTIDQQLHLGLTDPASLFQYAAINRHPFMVRLLYHYFFLQCRQLAGNDTLAHSLSEHELYRSLQGEITSVTQNIIDDHRRRKQPYDFLDLVIYTGYLPPKINQTNARQVLENVYQLLHPGGALLLGFPLVEDSPAQVSFKDLVLLAREAGFAEDKGRIHVGTSNMANERLPFFIFLVK